MFNSKKAIISFALTRWANEIETGDSAFNVNDCIDRKITHLIKKLNDDQRQLVARIRKLAGEYDGR
jgi:hypothetical protein